MDDKIKGHGDILTRLLDSRKMSVPKLSELTEIPKQTLYTIKKSNTRGTNKRTLERISFVLNVPNEVWDSATIEEFNNNLSYRSRRIAKMKNCSLKKVSEMLSAVGFNYTEEELQDYFNQSVSVLKKDNMIDNMIGTILDYGRLISVHEFDLIFQYRIINKKQRRLIQEIIQNLVMLNTTTNKHIDFSPVEET